MFGKLGDMIGKLQEMKLKADEIKLKLDGITIQSDAAGGDIQVEISGNRKFKKITIDPALQHGEAKELELQLLGAINKAIEEAEKINEQEMKKAASGLLPGL